MKTAFQPWREILESVHFAMHAWYSEILGYEENIRRFQAPLKVFLVIFHEKYLRSENDGGVEKVGQLLTAQVVALLTKVKLDKLL